MNSLFATVVPSPSPTPPAYTGDPALVSPGVIGFVAMGLIAVAVIFLILDMNRRIRRVRYRSEVGAKLDAERAAAAAAVAGEGDAGRAAGSPDGVAETASEASATDDSTEGSARRE